MKSFENMTYLSTDPLFQPIQVNPKDVGVSFYRIADLLKSPGATWEGGELPSSGSLLPSSDLSTDPLFQSIHAKPQM